MAKAAYLADVQQMLIWSEKFLKTDANIRSLEKNAGGKTKTKTLSPMYP